MTDFYKQYNSLDEHRYFKSDIIPPSWDNIIDNMDRCVVHNTLIKTTDGFGIVLHETLTNELAYINHIVRDMNEYFTDSKCDAHYYISFTSISKTFGKHKDSVDVWFFNAIGETQFTVYDKQVVTYNLVPGDMLYIPSGMFHETKPITPRVGISFGEKKIFSE